MGKKRNSLTACFLLLLWAPMFAQGDAEMADEEPATLSGVVRNSITGEPLAHVRIRLYLPSANSGDAGAYRAMTDAEGQFAIASIRPGTYVLSGERRGFGPGSISSGKNEKHPSETLTLKSSDEIKDVVVSLVPDAVITGRVVD